MNLCFASETKKNITAVQKAANCGGNHLLRSALQNLKFLVAKKSFKAHQNDEKFTFCFTNANLGIFICVDIYDFNDGAF